MILYILLIVFCTLMTLIALGLTIGGLAKKRRKVWTISLVAVVLFTLLSVFSIYSYIKATVNYMASDEFQAETRKKAENVGKTWGNTVSGTAQGLEETLDEDAIEKLARKGGRILGKGVKAAATGVDETVGGTTVFADDQLGQSGISIGRAEATGNKSISLFLESKSDFEGKLYLTSYDSKGQKQDVAELTIKQPSGKGAVHVFHFPQFEPIPTGYCILSK